MILAVGLSGYIRIAQTANYQFPLTFDQSRDLLDIRIPGTLKHFPVVGPTTSINGLYLGPGYYYFNLPAFWLGQGSPQALVNWNIFWFLAAGVAIFVFFYKRDIFLGLIISVIYLFAPQLFDTTRYFWNAHSMIYAMVFYFLGMWLVAEKATPKRALIWGMTAGFSMQFEAAMGIVAVIFSFLSILLSRNKKIVGWYLIGVFPWFLPQIAAEVLKGFRMTKLLLSESTNPTILGDKLTRQQTLFSHWNSFLNYFEGQFILNAGWGKWLLLISAAVGLAAKKYRQKMVWLLSFILMAFVFYLLTYRHELKIWYADSLRVWYVMVVGVGMIGLIGLIKKNKLLSRILIGCLVFFLIRNVFLTHNDQKQFIGNINFAKDDPKLMEHEIKAVDWVYKQMNGNGFKAYNFVPEIYDYPYQYVYWWYGNRKYGYMPGEVSYEPNVPQYINKQTLFYKNNRDSDVNIALIYETRSSYVEWLKKYDKYCVKEKIDFGWKVAAEIRQKCK